MRARLAPIVRLGWPVVAGVAVGLAIGGIWTLLQPSRYRADARVLVSGSAAGGSAAAIRALAESNLLEQNVAQTLHLVHVPRVSAKAGAGGVFTLSVEAGTRERARQIDAEAAQVLTRLVPARFGAAHLQAALLDPAHTVGRTSPTPGRNLLVGALLGLLAGLVAAATFVRRQPLPVIAGTIDPAVERRLRERVDAVTKRERALAKRAGELAAREKQLERRAEELAAAAARPAHTVHSEPEPAPPPEPEPEPEPILEPAAMRSGRINLDELERRVREHGAAFPDRLDDWNTYLFFLREHAGIDGQLPSTFDLLVADVFADVLDR